MPKPPDKAASFTSSVGSSPPNTVKIPSIQILPQVMPTLNTGDILRFNVRSNPPGEQGTLYYQGQLIKTRLPANVSAGDKLLARLEQTGEQVIFKILEHIKSDGTTSVTRENSAVTQSKTAGSAAPGSQLEQMVHTVEDVLARITSTSTSPLSGLPDQSLSSGLNTASRPLILTGNEGSLSEELNSVISTFVSSLTSAEALGSAQVIQSNLQAASQGNTVAQLRNAAAAITNVLQNTTIASPTTDRFLGLLHEQLIRVLDLSRSGAPAEVLSKQIDTLLHAIGEELKLQKNPGASREEDRLKLVFTDLKLARQNTALANEHLTSAQGRIEDYAHSLQGNDQKQTLDSKSVSELKILATRLESLANAHETLAQLNPVMQALGEPALILFPFIFQGLLQHGEVSIDPNARRKQQKKSPPDTETEAGYERIRIRVPLPYLGPIEIDIAHRKSEILTKIRLEDRAAANYLTEQSERLRTILRQANIELLEFSAESTSTTAANDSSVGQDRVG
jgi:hypothetical protein